MAKKDKDAPGVYDPATFYQVTMLIPHKLGRVLYSPMHRYRMTGALLSEIPPHKIAAAEVAE